MKVSINNVGIHYFKGIRNWRVDCQNADIIKISGRNGTGKTSIADAVQWCLWGKNSSGDTVFGIKTLDENGVVIPDVEHYVEVCLSVVDEGGVTDYKVKRVWVEKKNKRRGRETDEVKHETEFYVNGELFSKADYTKWLEGIAPSESFRLISNPTYFFSLDWKLQRNLLQELAGDIDYTTLNGEYADVLARVKEHQDLEGYKKHLSYNIKLIKEKVATIPARIDEQRQTIPESHDWSQLCNESKEIDEEIAKLRLQINDLQNDKSSAGKNNLLRDKIEFQRKRIDEMATGARNIANIKAQEHEEKVRKARQELATAQRMLDDAEAKQNSYTILLARSKEALKATEDEITAFRRRWNENESRVFAVSSDVLTCPMCGREYDGEKREEVISKAREDFAARKAASKAELLEMAGKIKATKAEAEAAIASYEEALLINSNSEHEKKLNECKKALAEVEQEIVPTSGDILKENANYQDALSRINELTEQLNAGNSEVDNSAEMAELTQQLTALSNRSLEIAGLLSVKAAIDAHQKRITELEEEEVALNTQLAELYACDDCVRDYEQAMNDTLEREVNKHFENTRFRMFAQLNDGTKKPWCTATIEGVEYSDANRAAQINAGLEICDVFAHYKGIIAPIIIDNAEAINSIRHTQGQQVQLYVSNEELKVEAK